MLSSLCEAVDESAAQSESIVQSKAVDSSMAVVSASAQNVSVKKSLEAESTSNKCEEVP